MSMPLIARRFLEFNLSGAQSVSGTARGRSYQDTYTAKKQLAYTGDGRSMSEGSEYRNTNVHFAVRIFSPT